MKNIAILGSTGSIGTQTLQVIDANPGRFNVEVLTANNQVELLARQARKFKPNMVVIGNEAKYSELTELLKDEDIKVYAGSEAIAQVVQTSTIDVVVTAMVGYSGLLPTINAIKAGKTIALANKETLVVAGDLINRLVEEYKVAILPVDSEHSAIFQCLVGEHNNPVEKILLTASGGPFRGRDYEYLKSVTAAQALKHPNWSMGAKITIDSATMINKGLEMIEAKWLFDVDIDKIHVLVQPKSVIHSMVGFVDGAVMAQLGTPDMRLPIQYALYYPERNYLGGERLNFEALADIQFEKPNTDVLRGIPIAVGASRIGGSMLTAMNAANEYAVARFLKKDIAFLQIYDMIEYAMSKHQVIKHPDLSQILETERETYERLNKDWRNVSR